jgi:hypothetical protein
VNEQRTLLEASEANPSEALRRSEKGSEP